MEIVVIDRQRTVPFGAAGLRRFLAQAAGACAVRADSVAVCLVGDRGMRRLNRDFRGKDRTTDVLSFPGDARRDAEGRIHLGDIVINLAQARRQAREHGHTLTRESRLLALHGLLHLQGYDHERDDGTMLRLQRRLERRLLPPPRQASR